MNDPNPRFKATVDIEIHAPDEDAVDDLIHEIIELGDTTERVYTVWTRTVDPATSDDS